MKKPWESDSREFIQNLYPVPVAAALWCGVPPDEVQNYLDKSNEVDKGVFRHPGIKDLEHRCRAIHKAIETGILLVSREDGKLLDSSTIAGHVKPEQRHVNRQTLKEWISREFPSDKPRFLSLLADRGRMDENEKRYWLSKDAWTGLEAACLLCNKDIKEAQSDYDSYKRDDDYPLRPERETASVPDIKDYLDSSLIDVFKDLINAAEMNVLSAKQTARHPNQEYDWLFSPSEIIAWAVKKPGLYPKFPFTPADIEPPAYTPGTEEKPLTITERKTFLCAIAALCKEAKINLNDKGAAKKLAIIMENSGAPVSENTVRGWLKGIPDAVEIRMK